MFDYATRRRLYQFRKRGKSPVIASNYLSQKNNQQQRRGGHRELRAEGNYPGSCVICMQTKIRGGLKDLIRVFASLFEKKRVGFRTKP
jgi:hypothetical protein